MRDNRAIFTDDPDIGVATPAFDRAAISPGKVARVGVQLRCKRGSIVDMTVERDDCAAVQHGRPPCAQLCGVARQRAIGEVEAIELGRTRRTANPGAQRGSKALGLAVRAVMMGTVPEPGESEQWTG